MSKLWTNTIWLIRPWHAALCVLLMQIEIPSRTYCVDWIHESIFAQRAPRLVSFAALRHAPKRKRLHCACCVWSLYAECAPEWTQMMSRKDVQKNPLWLCPLHFFFFFFKHRGTLTAAEAVKNWLNSARHDTRTGWQDKGGVWKRERRFCDKLNRDKCSCKNRERKKIKVFARSCEVIPGSRREEKKNKMRLLLELHQLYYYQTGQKKQAFLACVDEWRCHRSRCSWMAFFEEWQL